MRLTDLFIHRPVLSCVVSILVLVFGLRAEQALPIGKFPRTVSAVVEIQTSYYGADPAAVAGYVTTPLESRISQAQGIDYMTSTSSIGLSDITVTLKLNYDPVRALAEIQSDVTAATAQLPSGVQPSTIFSYSTGFSFMGITVDSGVLPPSKVDDYVQRVVTPRLQAISGVQRVYTDGGSPNVVMRVWLDPERLAAYGLTAADVYSALGKNNFVTGAGSTLGGATSVNLDITSSLHDAAQFRDLVIRQNNLHIIRLRDVGRVEFGSDPDNLETITGNRRGVYIGITLGPSANALAVSHDLEAQIATLRRQAPPAIHINILTDNGDYIRSSIREVAVTLGESMLIVALVVFGFLGSPRAVLVPLVAIPLSLTGTLAMMAAMGFSINLLTLLALVLAIGLVVDDAIIVVENVNRHLALGLRPVAAASAAARELVQPILAMTVVLIAAYMPLGLQGGLTGALFIEFAFTLAGAVAMSALLALTLSPMMSSRLLRARSTPGMHMPGTHMPGTRMPGMRMPIAERMERASEHTLDAVQRGYSVVLHLTLRVQPLVLVLGLLVLGSTWYLYGHARHELSPAEDTGDLAIAGSSAPNSTFDAVALYDPEMIDIFNSVPEVKAFFVFNQAPTLLGGLKLKDWSQRTRDASTIGNRLQEELARIPGIDMGIYSNPYLPGANGMPIEFVLQSAGDFPQLNQVSDAFLARVRASGMFAYADKDLKIDQPKSTIVVDRAKLAALDLTMSDLGSSLNAMLGGGFTGFFSADQRSYKVEPMAMRRFRLNPDQILDYPIKTIGGLSVPLRSVAHIADSVVPESIAHFQQLNATTIQAVPAPGVTQGQAYDYLQHLAAELLPAGYGTDTTGPLRQYVQESGGFAATFALAVVVTYLALAALFESFRDPLIILVSVPMSIAGALLFVWAGVGGASINLFTEVGLVTLMGLISKHGILIVEVAKEGQAMGLCKREAIERACALRLRPILMTTAAMVLGVMPLVFATGAGAASRFVMGLVIASGLSIGTLFTLFVLPAVYMLLAAARNPVQLQKQTNPAARLAGQELSIRGS